MSGPTTQVANLEGEAHQHRRDLLHTKSLSNSLQEQHDQDLQQEQERRMCLEEDHQLLLSSNLQNESQCKQLANRIAELEAQLKLHRRADGSR